ncbi:MAG: hypothetical protein ACFFBS_02185 [Promethearchaeota archaeon]
MAKKKGSKDIFSSRFKKVDGGKASDIAGKWDSIVRERDSSKLQSLETGESAGVTETPEMIKISIWIPKHIKKDIDRVVEVLGEDFMAKPFAKPSVIIREALEVGYPETKKRILGMFEKTL